MPTPEPIAATRDWNSAVGEGNSEILPEPAWLPQNEKGPGRVKIHDRVLRT